MLLHLPSVQGVRSWRIRKEISRRPTRLQDSEIQQYLQYCRIFGSTHTPAVLEQAVCRTDFEGLFFGGAHAGWCMPRAGLE